MQYSFTSFNILRLSFYRELYVLVIGGTWSFRKVWSPWFAWTSWIRWSAGNISEHDTNILWREYHKQSHDSEIVRASVLYVAII